MQQLDYNNGSRVFLYYLCRDVIRKGQCKLRVSSVRDAVKKGLELVKLKNLHCHKPLPGNGW
jgi:hypothetical protein